jgi:antitoxin CptB
VLAPRVNGETTFPPGRLRWRARRGTRELDALLGGWLDHGHAAAGAALQADFDALLDVADPLLWDWLTGRAVPDPRFAAIVDAIRARHRV